MSFVLHPQLANDTFFITDLPLCRVLLMNESRYPWLILVPRRAEIREIYELTPEDRRQFWQESDQVSRALVALFQPDKLNISALGNVVPQLHIHHIASFTQDEAWPTPVLGRFSPKPYTTQAVQDLSQSVLKSLLS